MDRMSSSGIFSRSLLMIATIVFCMFLVAVSGLLDDDKLHIGHERYAETIRLPFWDVMPLNTVVNMGYIVVGLYWCGITNVSFNRGSLKSLDCVFFYLFNNMACMYGIVSIIRMITQGATWAIMDRWLTLLFFALVPLWASHIRDECELRRSVIMMSASILCYFYTLVMPDFYQIIVALHILRAVHGGCMAFSKYRSPDSMYYFLGALCSCFLFVGGNLLDMRLPNFSRMFNYISGHFISRIFDAAQIHFTNAFFFDLTLQKANGTALDNTQELIQGKCLTKEVGTDTSIENHVKEKDI